MILIPIMMLTARPARFFCTRLRLHIPPLSATHGAAGVLLPYLIGMDCPHRRFCSKLKNMVKQCSRHGNQNISI